MPSRRPSALRIVVTMAVCLVISAVAVVAGFWQYGRHVDRADARAAYDAAVEAPAADVGDVAAPGEAALPEGAEWRTVTATGRFDPSSVTILRGRPIDREPSWQFLAWLDTDDGSSLLVSIGRIGQPGPLEDPEMPELDTGESVTVTGVLRAWEADDDRATASSITRITPRQLPTPGGVPVPGYVMVREVCGDDGCSPAAVGLPVPLPELTLGPHLSYAFQWWIFAVLAPVGGVLLLRRDARMESEDSDGGDAGAQPPTDDRAPAGTPRRPRRPRRSRSEPTDEEIEDAL